MSQATKDVATHEFVEPSSQANICHAAIYPDDVCAQPRDAAIHRASVPAEPCCPYHALGGFPYSTCRFPDQDATLCEHGRALSDPCEHCFKAAGDAQSTEAIPPKPESYIYQQAIRLARRMASQSATEDTDNRQFAYSVLLEVARSSHEAKVSKLREALRGLADAVDEFMGAAEKGEHVKAQAQFPIGEAMVWKLKDRCAAARDALKGE